MSRKNNVEGKENVGKGNGEVGMGRGKKRKEDVGKIKGEGLRALTVKGGRGRENLTGLFLLNFKPTAGDTQNRIKWLYRVAKPL